MNSKVIFLDIGNVIVQLDYETVLSRIGALTTLSREEIVRRIYPNPDVSLYETGHLSTLEFYQRMCRQLELQSSLEVFQETWGSLFDPRPDHLLSPSLFRRLRLRYPVIALSNTNEMHFSWLKKIQPLVHEFDDYVLSFEVKSMKPDLAIYREALSRVDADPAETVFVDDRADNVRAARRLGICGIQFVSEDQLERDLKDLGVPY